MEKKGNPLFALMDALFTSKEYINNITRETAKQNIFMVLRKIGIKYPLQANAFNDGKVNPLDVIKYWSNFLYTGNRPPSWIYTKVNEKKHKKFSASEIKLYKKHYDINDKDFNDCMRFFKEETEKDIEDILKFYDDLKSNQ